MRNTVHTLVIDNINSINASNLLLEVTVRPKFIFRKSRAMNLYYHKMLPLKTTLCSYE